MTAHARRPMWKRTVLLTLALAFLANRASAQTSALSVAWDPNTESDVTGYLVSWGTSSHVYSRTQSVGSATEFTATNLAPGTRYYFAVQAISQTGLLSGYSAEVSGIAPEPTSGVPLPDPGTVAFNRSGSLDLVWQHETTGWLAASQLNGTTLSKPGLILPGQVDTRWHIEAVVDLDRDGYPDLIWRDPNAGYVATWRMRGTQMISSGLVGPGRVLDLDWGIVGGGDFDGDGWNDLVWYHKRTGIIAVWLMKGTALRQSVVLSVKIPDVAWELAGVGDLDGDRHPDLVWRHSKTGAIAVWFMNGLSYRSSTLLTPGYVTDLNWRIAAVTDTNHDGFADLIWQHGVTGWIGLWQMRGSRLVSSFTLGGTTVSDPAWHVVGGR